jgi:outer membrane protein assembly factor BamB
LYRLLPKLAVLAVASLALAQGGSPAPGDAATKSQEPSPPRREVPKPVEFTGPQGDSLYSVTRSQEDIHEWEEARAELERGEHATAVDRLHRLLQKDSGGVVATGPASYAGLRLAALLTLANVGPTASEAYEQLVVREAGALVGKPLQSLPEEQVRILAERFPTSAIGRSARLRLGDLELEQGRGVAAGQHYRAALDAAPFGSRLEGLIAARLRAADAMERPVELREGNPPADVRFVLEAVSASKDSVAWSSAAGGVGGATRMADPLGRPTPRWTAEVSAPGFEYATNNYPMQLVGTLDAIYLNRGTELVALDPLRQNVLWTSPSPLLDQGSIGVMREYAPTINGNTVLCAAVEGDVVVAALQVPDSSTTRRFMSNYTIMSKLPDRRLFAFDRRTGKLLWAHFDTLEGPVARRFHGHVACGPPLIVGDTVYAPVHDRSGAIAFYVGAYDLRTGQPRWRRLVCSSQQEVNMFGNARRDFAASPLCAKGGIVYGSSNLGVAFAIEQATGRIRWLAGYDVLRMPKTDLHNQADRTVFFQNNAPILCDGVVCFTPLDSEFVLALDAETGNKRWQMPFEARTGGSNWVRWLFGALDGEFLFAGAGVVAVRADANAPQLRLVRGSESLRGEDGGDCPRPALSDRWIYYASQGRISVFDKNGNAAPESVGLKFRGSGNLLLLDGIALSLSGRLLEASFDPEALSARAEQRLERTPDDPFAILELCTLRAAFTKDRATVQPQLAKLYRQGLAASIQRGIPKDQPPRSIFQRSLFESALASAEAASGSEQRSLLMEARELAPDDAAFVQAQAGLLLLYQADRAATLRELEVLSSRASDRRGEFKDAGSTLPVAAYVLWRRAGLAETPAEQVALWQQLLLDHPDAVVLQQTARELAHAKIAGLIEQHGATVYAAIEQRAAAERAEAGDDSQRLQRVGERFPHSAAGAAARARLLDLAVERGDLATTTDVLGSAQRADKLSPGLLRRVLEGARRGGNFGIARAVALRLQTMATLASDWPADNQRTYGELLPKLLPPLAETTWAPTPTAAPEVVLATIPNPSPRTVPKLVAVTVADGFAAAPDAPLYVITASEKLQLRAIEVQQKRNTPLFAHELDQLADRIWLCGRTLIVCDSQQVEAIDYRTGETRWKSPRDGFYECYGVIQGVLLVTRQSQGAEGEDPILSGIEPLSGHTLFSRVLPAAAGPAAPKATATDLLWLRQGDRNSMAIERIDPLSGRSHTVVPIADSLLVELGLRAEVLHQALLFPQELAADQERIYLKAEPPMSTGPAGAVALRKDGSVAWRWTGNPGVRLMLAHRGDHVVLAEGLPLFAHNQTTRQGDHNRVLVLAAASGEVLRELPIGAEFMVRNWQRGTWDTPAPAALIGEDTDPRSGDRRVVCIGIDDGVPTFVEPFGAQEDDMVPGPMLGTDLVIFGHRPDRGGNVRVFGLDLKTRKGALLGGNKFLRLRGPVTGMGPAGAYTAVAGQEGIFLLGPAQDAR